MTLYKLNVKEGEAVAKQRKKERLRNREIVRCLKNYITTTTTTTASERRGK